MFKTKVVKVNVKHVYAQKTGDVHKNKIGNAHVKQT